MKMTKRTVSIAKTRKPLKIGKISADLESLKNCVGLAKFENNNILLNKISHRFLVTTTPFTRANVIKLNKAVSYERSQ
jgi:hypothetical protein